MSDATEDLAPQDGTETPPSVYFSSRRKWLAGVGAVMGVGAAAYGAYWLGEASAKPDGFIAAARSKWTQDAASRAIYPAEQDTHFAYGREETTQVEAARYTNFYEFSRFKSCWRYVSEFEPYPWKIQVTGLCRKPRTLDLDDLLREYRSAMRERQYRHRCVERWAMAIPWTGIPLATLLKDAEPLASATHVRFVSFDRPAQASNQQVEEYPWPYVEGLRIDEAMHDLAFLAVGLYGEPLLKQHGAPIRVITPWKYGYKSPKSIQVIEFLNKEPATFWSTLNPAAYPFESNVDPQVARPWSQAEERMLGTDEVFATKYLNGYADQVASLYSR